MLSEAVSHAWTPALTTNSSARPVTRNGTSRSSDSPPTQSVSTSGERIAGRGAAAVADAVTGALHALRRWARSGSPLAEEGIEVEGVGHPELDAAFGRERPLLPRAIPGELEPDPVGVGQVDRNADAVIRRALEREARGEHPLDRQRETAPRGIPDRA